MVTARIAASAETRGNARATRTAIVEIASATLSYTILAWYKDSD